MKVMNIADLKRFFDGVIDNEAVRFSRLNQASNYSLKTAEVLANKSVVRFVVRSRFENELVVIAPQIITNVNFHLILNNSNITFQMDDVVDVNLETGQLELVP